MTDREYLTHIIECADDLNVELENLKEEVHSLKRCIFEELDSGVTDRTIEMTLRCLERIGMVIRIGKLNIVSWDSERRTHE